MLRLLSVRRLSQAASLFRTVVEEEPGLAKMQKFMTFCDQMERLAQFQEKRKELCIRRDHELRTCTFTTREPIKATLNTYISYRQDWSSEHTVTCLEWLADVLAARREHFYTDLSVEDLFEDWRFVRILDDIRIGLKPGMFYPPDHLGRTMKAMAAIGYKNSELIREMGEKALHTSSESYNYSPLGHHIYTGFESHPDFQSYVHTLLEWNQLRPSPLKSLNKALDIANQAHNFSKEYAAALMNVASQYYDLVKAQHETTIFRRDLEVDAQLAELQDILVRAGLMHPDDFESIDNFLSMDEKMKRAERVFSSLRRIFPQLDSPVVSAVIEHNPNSDPEAVKLAESRAIPNANAFAAMNLGVFAEGLADLMTSPVKDRNRDDFPNEFWRKRGTTYLAEKVPEVLDRSLITPHLSQSWQAGLNIFSQLLPIAKSVISAGSTQELCLVLYGMARGRVIDSEFCEMIEKSIQKGTVETRERVKGLFGAAMTGKNEGFAKRLLAGFPAADIRDMDKRDLVQLTWSLILLDQSSAPLFPFCLSALNDGSIIPKDLNMEMSELIHDIYQFLSLRKTASNDLIPRNLVETVKVMDFFDPVRETIAQAIRPMMGLTLSKEEQDHFKTVLKARVPALYPMDDVLVLNQQLAPVMLMGTDGFSQNGELLLGKARMQELVFGLENCKPLFIPVHCLANIDFSSGLLTLNRQWSLRQFVAARFGEFSDFLSPLDQTMESTLETLWRQSSPRNEVPVSLFLVVKQLLALYKLQEVLKLKTTPHEIAEKIEEMKVQIVKIDVDYRQLPDRLKDVIPGLDQTLRDCYRKLVSTPEVKSELPDYVQQWVGVRQAHELPPSPSAQKDIDPELINHSYLWVSNFFNYRDWEEHLTIAYPLYKDMAMVTNDQQNRTFFTGRRQMYGCTPDPVLEVNTFMQTPSIESALMASLTNLKYELKRNFTDSQILDKILNLDLVERLTEEHLGKNAQQQKKLVPRDPLEFVRMMDHAEYLKSDLDMFARYYRKVHMHEVARDRLFTDSILQIRKIDESQTQTSGEKNAARNKVIEDYMDAFRKASPDDPDLDFFFADGKQQRLTTVTDPKSLKPLERSIFEDEDFLSVSSDEGYLSLKRLKAESKLIKASILRKLAKGQPLSTIQAAYLDTWKSELQSLKLPNAGRCFMPSIVTSQSYADLSATDRSFFHSLRKVVFPEDLANYGLSDLVLELSHFIDDEVINRVEFLKAETAELAKWKGLLPAGHGKSRLKPEWVNKEVQLRNLELEEELWLHAGKMTEEDFKVFEKLYGFQRGKTRVDRFWWPLEMKSWKEFTSQANEYENRLDLMRAWYRRKSREPHIQIPTGQFARPDSQLHADILRARIISSKEEVEEFTEKEYDSLTDQELRDTGDMIIEEYVMKAHDQPNLLWGVLLHPNLSQRSKEELETIAKKYNLLGRFDDPVEPLANNPVPFNGDKLAPRRTAEEWEKLLEQANADYLTPLLTSLSK